MVPIMIHLSAAKTLLTTHWFVSTSEKHFFQYGRNRAVLKSQITTGGRKESQPQNQIKLTFNQYLNMFLLVEKFFEYYRRDNGASPRFAPCSPALHRNRAPLRPRIQAPSLQPFTGKPLRSAPEGNAFSPLCPECYSNLKTHVDNQNFCPASLPCGVM